MFQNIALCSYVCSDLHANIVLTKLKSFIEKNKLFNKSDQIGLAISGGRDSVCASYMLNDLKIPFIMVHVNFNLRGKESYNDQKFVERLSKKLPYSRGIKVLNSNAENYAFEKKVSIQEAAREIRYAYFEDLKQSGHFDKLITAHHQNDMVETFLINLNRKSGINGLKSIPIKRRYIVRPFLALNTREINTYIANHNIKYREDSSNQSLKYLRNVIRKKVIPSIETSIPHFVDNTLQSINLLKAEKETLDYLLNQQIENITSNNFENLYIEKKPLLNFPHPAAVLYQILDGYRFNIYQCKKIIASFNGIPGKIFKSETHQLIVDREQIILEINTLNQDVITIKKQGSYSFANYSVVLKKAQKWTYNPSNTEEILQISPDLFPLFIRNWKKGDRFIPLGMKGSKLLSDFFIDQKINVLEKSKIPLLCSGDKVLWVVGHQISDLVKVSENKNVYHVSYTKEYKSSEKL